MGCNFTNKTLVFFTAEFPFGKGETFVENELPFLEEYFDKIIIVSNSTEDPLVRKVSNKIRLIRTPYRASNCYRLKVFLYLFGIDFLREIIFAFRTVGLLNFFSAFSFQLSSYAKALEVKDMIDDLVWHDLKVGNHIYLYSYWLYDMTLGMVLFKRNHPEVVAVSRSHRWDLYFETNSLNYLPFRRAMINGVDKCYVISEDGIEYMLRRIPGMDKTKLALSRLGTFNDLYLNSKSRNDVYTIVSCSTLTKPKRVHLIIEALSDIAAIKVRWIHFGDGLLRREIEELAERKLKDNTNVNYQFTGSKPNSEILDFYFNNRIDLFVNVSDSEGVPVSIMEALSFGSPVVATNVGGNKEIIEDGVNGYLLPPDFSSDQLREKIKSFHNLTEAEKQEWSHNCFSSWEHKFNARKNYNQFTADIINLHSTVNER